MSNNKNGVTIDGVSMSSCIYELPTYDEFKELYKKNIDNIRKKQQLKELAIQQEFCINLKKKILKLASTGKTSGIVHIVDLSQFEKWDIFYSHEMRDLRGRVWDYISQAKSCQNSEFYRFYNPGYGNEIEINIKNTDDF